MPPAAAAAATRVALPSAAGRRTSTLRVVIGVVLFVVLSVWSWVVLPTTDLPWRRVPSKASPVADAGAAGSAVPSRTTSTANGGAHDIPSVSAASRPDTASNDNFTIVMLSYKAPMSLTATLQSLALSGVLAHPRLQEVLVYFQARRPEVDEALVRDVLDAAYQDPVSLVRSIGMRSPPPLRVLGDGSNLPVAEATFRAIDQVQSKYVLYLECDRPAFPYAVPAALTAGAAATAGDALATLATVEKLPAIRMITAAMRFLGAATADVFRLQLYSNPRLDENTADDVANGVKRPWPNVTSTRGATKGGGGRIGNSVLHSDIYGADTTSNCLGAPALTPAFCRTAKSAKGRVFHTAYCKHWVKFSAVSKPRQQDLCDAFCFAEWAVAAESAATRAANPRKFDGVSLFAEDDPTTPIGRVTNATRDDALTVVCLDSEQCNWTNQPTMYTKAWYQQAVVAPCLASPRDCVGQPGRRSAVLQENFFVKHTEAWAQRRHRVCLHRDGLFFHHEIDNRE